MPRTSGNSEEIIRIAMPSEASLLIKRMDSRLGADIDAARRLIEDQDARVGGQPFCQHHLLLVAA